MRVLDLFSGIGGFSLGLERAGMETVAFCEIDPFCRRVLAKHWPEVPCYDDIRTLSAQRLEADGIAVDVICGGFPCQDISNAGKRAGIEGERSGLWSEYARLIGEIRPRYVIVENVAALVGRGLDRVLRDLASLGFDAEWHCIPASAVGAPHRRDRLWIIGHPSGLHSDGGNLHAGGDCESAGACQEIPQSRDLRSDLANANGTGLQASGAQPVRADRLLGGGMLAPDSWWGAEPNVGRVAHGVPSRVDRLRSLGNAVVPQIPEIIGRAIMETERAS